MIALPLCEKGNASVSWSIPHVNPGSSITGYSIQYKVSGSNDPYTDVINKDTSITNIKIDGLKCGTQYQVRVAAETELGVTSESYGIDKVTPLF